MSLPRWFLERDDSDYLFKELFRNYGDVVETIKHFEKNLYIFCYNDFSSLM